MIDWVHFERIALEDCLADVSELARNAFGVRIRLLDLFVFEVALDFQATEIGEQRSLL